MTLGFGLSPSKNETGQPDKARVTANDDGKAQPLNSAEREWKGIIYQKLLKVIDLTGIPRIRSQEVEKNIRELCEGLLSEQRVPLTKISKQRVISSIVNEVLGLGPIDLLMSDKSITDILVNGYSDVYIERRGKLERTDVVFDNDTHLMNIIDRIVNAVGRRVDESSPMVDARLEDGSRVNVIIPPLAIDGPVLSIRRFGSDELGVRELVELGTLTDDLVTVLEAVVKARLNLVVSGGTGSGKTTLLNLLSGFVPENERIITIEDSAELKLRQPHVVRLETRTPNLEGQGAITQRDLVRNSLRMRPDRIVLGEVRGGEALDMLQAMNTGHDGSLTTIHANSPRDALIRIENLVSMSGVSFPIPALRRQITAAIQLIIHIERMLDGRRRVVSVVEVNDMEGEVITLSEIFSFTRQGVDEAGRVIGSLHSTGIVPNFVKRMVERGIDLPMQVFRLSQHSH
jgi:pilus assembly protein CpaF